MDRASVRRSPRQLQRLAVLQTHEITNTVGIHKTSINALSDAAGKALCDARHSDAHQNK